MSGKQKNKFANARYARSAAYRKDMGEILAAGVCPFCPGQMRWHTKPVLRRRGGWFITESTQPYTNASHHLLVISERHKEGVDDITARDWTAIRSLVRWAVKERSIKGGGITFRFGEFAYNGSTVKHAHMHLIVPTVANGETQYVNFPIG